MVIIILACAVVAYDLGKVALAKYSVQRAEDGYVLGARDGDLKLVEFLDYGCRHCQDLHPILMRALERDGNVVYLARPIFAGPDENGTRAGRLALAAGRQGKFVEAHQVLIENYRPIDDVFINTFAQTLAIDAAQLQAVIDVPEIDQAMIDNLENLKALKGQYVP